MILVLIKSFITSFLLKLVTCSINAPGVHAWGVLLSLPLGNLMGPHAIDAPGVHTVFLIFSRRKSKSGVDSHQEKDSKDLGQHDFAGYLSMYYYIMWSKYLTTAAFMVSWLIILGIDGLFDCDIPSF